MSSSIETFDADRFISQQVGEIKKSLGEEKAIIAVSGGVDSTTCAALTRKAIGSNLLCVFIDTAFMRKGEPERVKRTLAKPPLRLPLRIVRAQKRFMDSLKGLTDAEDKRKAFREAFYSTLADAARSEGCSWLVQGTIAPDLIETEGGVKTQHNVLEQIGIDPKQKYGFKVIEPVAQLYKPQVRILSRKLGFPEETSERQPFPGPGLMVRCVAEVSPRKLRELKTATAIVEKELRGLGAQQYFAAIIDNTPHDVPAGDELKRSLSTILGVKESLFKLQVLSNLATGVSEGRRIYGKMAAIVLQQNVQEELTEILARSKTACRDFAAANPEYARLLLLLDELPRRKEYAAVIRAVRTEDFMTADALQIPLKTLRTLSSKILRNCRSTSSVYYDLTPKPPATIEFE
jgi:GMP synthase (glutamine-hydrolysing)